MSPTLAGVTLLAFGNGAPDMFSSILAAKKLKIFLALGALFGGALFVNSVVLFRVVIQGGEAKMNLSKLLRDSGFLMLTVSTILFYGYIGKITIFQACLFPLLYLIYVGVVLCTEKTQQSLSSLDSLELPMMESNRIDNCLIIEDYVASVTSQSTYTIKRSGRSPHSLVSNIQWSVIKFKYFLQQQKVEFSSMTPVSKFIYIMLFPIAFIRKLTIPFYTNENWDRTYATCMPLSSIFFVLLTQEWMTESVIGIELWILGLILGLFGCCYIWCTSKVSRPPHYNGFLTLIAFLMSIVWICTICSYMVDLLSLAGVLSGLPTEFLGMTMLAWGNSMGDFYANPAIAKLGLNQTGMTACFAGPLLNTLVGFGISLIISSTGGSITFNMYDQILVAISGVFLFISILVSICFGIYHSGYMTIKHAKLLLYLYITFMISITCYQFILMFD